MSRIGNQPIVLPSGVTVKIDGSNILVSGAKGELAWRTPAGIEVEQSDSALIVKPADSSRASRRLWGTSRAILANMVKGVEVGYQKKLEIEGVGYRANIKDGKLVLGIGFSHPVEVAPPAGISFAVEKNAIVVAGTDKVLVGETAAKIRSIRPPEPYKGKGIRYEGETIRRKAGKKAAAAE